ncbi:LysR substrate-binding domain-containing protein [Streptosporangium lutulentum]
MTIAAFPTVIRHLLVPALGVLAEHHPQITPRIHELYGPPALQELRLGGVDLAVTEWDADKPFAPQPSIVAHPLHVDEYRIVAPPDWKRIPRGLADLGEVPWVAGPPDQACGHALERLAAAGGFTPRRVHVIEEFPPRSLWSRRGTGWRSCRRWRCWRSRSARWWSPASPTWAPAAGRRDAAQPYPLGRARPGAGRGHRGAQGGGGRPGGTAGRASRGALARRWPGRRARAGVSRRSGRRVRAGVFRWSGRRARDGGCLPWSGRRAAGVTGRASRRGADR